MTALEKSGIISGYRVVINPLESPEMMTFLVNIEIKPEYFDDAKEAILQESEIVTLIQTTGKCHLIAICVSEDVKSMRSFINHIYKSVKGVLSVNAHTIIDVIKGSIIPE